MEIKIFLVFFVVRLKARATNWFTIALLLRKTVAIYKTYASTTNALTIGGHRVTFFRSTFQTGHLFPFLPKDGIAWIFQTTLCRAQDLNLRQSENWASLWGFWKDAPLTELPRPHSLKRHLTFFNEQRLNAEKRLLSKSPTSGLFFVID